jgi:hypothetical protein
LKKNEPQEITFPFVALTIGTPMIVFKIIGASNDAIQVELPILGVQEPIFVGTSFSLNGDDLSREKLSTINSTSGYDLNITAGVGKLPSILQLSSSLFDSFYIDFPYCLPNAYFSLLTPYYVSVVYPDAVDKDFKLKSKALFQKIIEKLTKCTHPSHGLQYGLEGDISRNPMFNSHLNAIALYFSKKLTEGGVILPSELVNSWNNALITHLDSGEVVPLDVVALSRYVLGKSWDPKNKQYSTENLIKNLNQLNVGGTTSLALAIIDGNEKATETEEIKRILQSLIDSFRIQGRTAYIADQKGSPHVTNILSTSLIIDLFVKTNFESPILEKISNYLSTYFSSNSGLNILALSTYDRYKGNIDPNLNLLIKLGDSELIQKSFTKTSEPIISKSFSLPSTFSEKTVEFSSSGKGEISVSVGLLFEPKMLNLYPVYRGFFVEKVIRFVDPLTDESFGSPIFEASPGTLISVVIQFTSSDDIFDDIKIVDPLAGCFEAIDPNIKEETNIKNPWVPFTPAEFKKDKVIFILRGMNAGTFTVEYKSYIVSSGVFVLPPTKVEVTSQPELMGLSSGNHFQSK